MTDKEKNTVETESQTESTLFTDPEKKKTAITKRTKRHTAIKKQVIAIIAAAVIAALAASIYLVTLLINKRDVELGRKWDEFKIEFQKKLDGNVNTANFAEWLKNHKNDGDVKNVLERDSEIIALLEKTPKLKKLVDNIEEEYKYADKIDKLVDDAESINLLDGEVLGTNNRIYIYHPLERKDIKSITVRNSVDEFTFVYDDETEDFVVEGSPNAPFDTEMFSSLVVSAGKPNMIERAFDSCTDFSQYGLDESQSPASFTVTSRSGVSNTLYIGNLTADGTGYYAKHADRDALYVIGSSLETTMLNDLENMISPTLTFPMSQSDNYTIKKFTVFSGEETTVGITFLDDATRDALGLNTSFYMFHPGIYAVNSTTYSEVLTVLTSFEGIETVVYEPSEEDFEKYGIYAMETVETDPETGEEIVKRIPAYAVTYVYPVQGSELEQWVYFSAKNENGNYYAYSPQFDLIAEVDGTTVSWLEWRLINWVDEPIFMQNINEMATITVESSTATRVFDLVGEDDTLSITERSTGIKPEVENFRRFYRGLLSIHLQGYVSEDKTEAELAEMTAGTPSLTLTIDTRAGRKTVYRFYYYSTSRTYYTVSESDGSADKVAEPVGEFYIMSADMTKVINDAEKVLNGITVDYEARN